MKKILDALYRQHKLGYAEAHEILINITTGKYNHSQIASFLTVFMMRGISVEELTGFRDALMELCLKIDFGNMETIDLCGTGGDEKNTFNISTLASFVVAGAGVKVAKHGNYGVSSVSGSSNVLEFLGYRFKSDQTQLQKELEMTNICFMHAPLFHPAMKTVAPIRRELGVKTFFNMLGPMVNPSSPKNQMVGVFSLELARVYHYIYQQSDKNYSVVFGLDGYDECSLTCDTKVLGNKGESILEPTDFGFRKIGAENIYGGDSIEASAKIFLAILDGKGTSEQENVVIANAALALQCALNEPLAESVARAKESLQSKKAFQMFNSLIKLQQ